jgi:enoyl-CoA hydratase/carnithine racemase
MIAQLRDERVGLWASVEAENVAQGELGRTADYAEGFRAFQEKRRPTFTGR